MDEEYFWTQLEADSGPINVHLKNIMKLQSLCSVAMGELSAGLIQAIEQDMRDMCDFLKAEEEAGGTPLVQIYGKRFAAAPQKFKFLAGEIALLLKLASIVKEKGFKSFYRHQGKQKAKPTVPTQVQSNEELDEYVRGAVDKIRAFYQVNDFGKLSDDILDHLDEMEVNILTRDDGVVLAEVFCPLCRKSGRHHQSVKLALSANNSWKIYSFTRHVTLVHINGAANETPKSNKRQALAASEVPPKMECYPADETTLGSSPESDSTSPSDPLV
uniref:Uncharacterized protein n=1 Tax=Culex tarsalis TaxID=7177 RepID=A0A1Q3FXM3_CULTA